MSMSNFSQSFAMNFSGNESERKTQKIYFEIGEEMPNEKCGTGTRRTTTFGEEIGCVPIPSEKYGISSQEKRASEWEMLLRKFSEAHKEECKTVSLDIPRVKRAKKTFPTGSSYEGTWDIFGMSGFGTYTFPNGVIYEGEFLDGMFHGSGELRYPSGAILEGKWKRGLITERTLIFPDGMEYKETNWEYCVIPDRRFTIERLQGLQPAGCSFLTAEQPTRDIPEGYYDTGDGFYDPNTKAVYSITDATHIIRKPSKLEQTWIISNCRTNPMKAIGPQPALYEEWSKTTSQKHPEYSATSRVLTPEMKKEIGICECPELLISPSACPSDSIEKGTSEIGPRTESKESGICQCPEIGLGSQRELIEPKNSQSHELVRTPNEHPYGSIARGTYVGNCGSLIWGKNIEGGNDKATCNDKNCNK